MAYCSVCGSKNPDVAKFCGGCGKEIGSANDSLQEETKSKNNTPSNIKADSVKSASEPFEMFRSIHHTLFVESNLQVLWQSWLVLTIVNEIINFGMYHFNVYKQDFDATLTLTQHIGLIAIFLCIFIGLVKIGINQKNSSWILVVMVIYIILFIYSLFMDEGIDSLGLALNTLTGNGFLKTKLYTALFILWDQLFGMIIELILLFRIYSTISAQKNN